MQFSQKCKPVSGKKEEFFNKKGEKVKFYKLVMIIDGDVWEVRTADEDKYKQVVEKMDKDVEIIFNVTRDFTGKIRLSL